MVDVHGHFVPALDIARRATHAVLALVRAEVDIDANVCLSQRMGDASKIFRGIALVKRLTGIHRAT
jgi:hypothetical protein